MTQSKRKLNLLKILTPLTVIVVVFIIALCWRSTYQKYNRTTRKATPEEAIYLQDLLESANKIKIIVYNSEESPPWSAEIIDKKIIAEFIEACKFVQVEKYCLCLSNVNIDCYLASGEIIRLNYYKGLFHQYVKFPNPWSIQGKPGESFMRMMSKFLDDVSEK